MTRIFIEVKTHGDGRQAVEVRMGDKVVQTPWLIAGSGKVAAQSVEASLREQDPKALFTKVGY